jgi:hypothetical protein
MITELVTNDQMYELAHKVRSKGELERFIERLAEDYEINHAVWENHSVPDFLLALADCSRRAGDGAEALASQRADFWQHMARLLLAATVVR